jgi:hypothetical protein
MSRIVEAGAQRVSVGGALTWVSTSALVEGARKMRDDGDFSVLEVPIQIKEWLS